MTNPEVRSTLEEVARLEQEHHWAAPLHREIDRLGQQWLLDGQLVHEQAQVFLHSVGKLASMYRTHIDFEDNVLFPLANRVLPSPQKAEMAREMARRRDLESPTH
jgi:hemerythrin-like domain-containing protein